MTTSVKQRELSRRGSRSGRLESGRTAAPDYRARKALPQDQIDAVKAKVNERTRDMMDLAILTAARPGELVKLTGEMIDKSGDVWVAEIVDHKMSHREGSTRVLLIPGSVGMR